MTLGLSSTPRARFTKVQIERDDDAVIRASSLDKFGVRRALEPETSHVGRLVAELLQVLDGLGRDSSVCQKPHASRAEGVHFVPCEGRGVDERLTDVFLFEVG